MMKNSFKIIFYYLVVIYIVLLFGYTAISKLMEQQKFILQMQLSPAPFMQGMAPVIAWVVPAAEALIITGLFFEKFRLLALKCTFLLMSIFTAYIVVMMLSGQELPCTCGGIISTLSWGKHLILNLTVIAVTGIAIKLHSKVESIEDKLDSSNKLKILRS